MNIVTVISLVLLVSAVVTILCSVSSKNDDLCATGGLLLVLWIVVNISFQLGATWQRFDWYARFEMKPIVKEGQP